MRLSPEMRIAAVLAAIGVLVGLVDLSVAEVTPRDPIAIGGDRFVERAVFCPPPLPSSESVVTLASTTDVPLPIGLEPQSTEKVDLAPERMLVREGKDLLNIVGYGGAVVAGAMTHRTGPSAGWGAARCSGVASDEWFFAAGSSLLGYDETLLLYNPFPDEAVAEIVFYTPGGDTTKANLADVAVPAREVVTVSVNESIRQEAALGVKVDMERGRVVAWRSLAAAPRDRPSGVQFSLGATGASARWYFAEGRLQQGVEEEIAVVNPSQREAVVNVTLVSDDQTLRMPQLVDQRVPPGTVKVFNLVDAVQGAAADLGSVSAIVRSANGVEVVAERTVWYGALGADGVASELGAAEPAEEWIVGPPSMLAGDNSLALLNPGADPVRVTITLYREEGPALSPAPLKDLRIKATRRMTVDLDRWTQGSLAMVVVRADGPVVAERWAYSATDSDVSTLLGTPLGALNER
jgi:hypothetical protein